MKRITDIDVRELLPQQDAFVMVDRLEQCDEQTTVSSLHIRPDNLFVDEGGLLEAGILEHMAQTAAARNGYMDKYVHGGFIRLGFIGEIKDATIYRRPQAGETLHSTMAIVSEILSLLLIKVEVRSGEELIADGHIKLVMTSTPSSV